MIFNEKYTKYWLSAVDKSFDGTIIPNAAHLIYFMKQIEMCNSLNSLDLGCSFGRFCSVLRTYSERVYGIDIDDFAINKAQGKGYFDLKVGNIERTGYPSKFFDFILCWAVWDLTDHIKTLSEISRILKNGGQVLITGKNYYYDPDDLLALNAEKNAFLKGFPTRYTLLNKLINNLDCFGLTFQRLFIFSRRGDFGLFKYKELNHISDQKINGYEYILLLKKNNEVSNQLFNVNLLESVHSYPAEVRRLANKNETIKEYFQEYGINRSIC